MSLLVPLCPMSHAMVFSCMDAWQLSAAELRSLCISSTALPQLASGVRSKWGFISCEAPPCRACPVPEECAVSGGRGAAAAAAKPPPPPPQPSTMSLMRTIARSEGPMALWRGTSAALLMAVPMVCSLCLNPFVVSAPRVDWSAPLTSYSESRLLA